MGHRRGKLGQEQPSKFETKDKKGGKRREKKEKAKTEKGEMDASTNCRVRAQSQRENGKMIFALHIHLLVFRPSAATSPCRVCREDHKGQPCYGKSGTTHGQKVAPSQRCSL